MELHNDFKDNSNVNVVKAFNTVSAYDLVNGNPKSVKIAGNNKEACNSLLNLTAPMGLQG